MTQSIRRILVVEDDPGLQVVLSKTLTHLGYEVLVAKDGAEGLNQFDNFCPDLVITDYQMPLMNGVDLIHQIKHSEPNIPVILSTGYGAPDVFIEVLRHSRLIILRKPFTEESLQLAIHKVVLLPELRGHPRNAVRFKTQLKATLDGAVEQALTRNLSMTGAYIESGFMPAVDSSILVTIHAGPEKITARGTVIWRTAEGTSGFGLRFEEFHPGASAGLVRILAQNLEEEPYRSYFT